jgi:hypothetical protein
MKIKFLQLFFQFTYQKKAAIVHLQTFNLSRQVIVLYLFSCIADDVEYTIDDAGYTSSVANYIFSDADYILQLQSVTNPNRLITIYFFNGITMFHVFSKSHCARPTPTAANK